MARCPSCGNDVRAGARFCDSCGRPLEMPVASEERKVVTILFADVTGSTELGEQLDPERLRAVLNTYFSSMSAAIEAWGGTIEKFIGDAVMAAFGVPVVREDDAERALRAALEMLDRLDDLNEQFNRQHGIFLRIRVGINTGEVIVPVDGPASDMLVAGDAVNVAARLEQAADPGSVLVGHRTQLSTRNSFAFEGPLELRLKGKSEAVQAWRLRGETGAAVRGVPGLRASMVGRDRELQTLLDALDEAVENGRPRAVLVYGPAGIGKSRLVMEFERRASALHPDGVFLRGRCLAAGKGITYWPLAEMLRGICGIALDDPADAAARKLRAGVERALAPLAAGAEAVSQTLSALATTAGIRLEDNPLDDAEPRAVAEELARAWPLLATAMATHHPAILVVEDLHWAAPDLLDMLERLLARTSGPLVLVATARNEFAQEHSQFAAGLEGLSSVSLRPLTDDQSAMVVEELLAEADLPEGLRTEILEKAEGNPFFLEEILRRLIDEGALLREGSRWRTTERATSIPVPDTVHGLLAARIDALPPAEKRVLQEAAVVGRTFWEEPVQRALGNGEVGRSLLALERRGLVLVRPASTVAGQVEYAFKHALVREVAYGSLPKSRRARAHAELGAWLEELAGDREGEFAELLAHHYGSAVLDQDADLAWAEDPAARDRIRIKALESLVAAGVAARHRFALRKAVELHEQALALTTEPERGKVLEELGADHAAGLHGDEALAAYREALELARRSGDRAAVAGVCVGLGEAASWAGTFRTQPDPSEIEDVVLEGLANAEDEHTRARLLLLRGMGDRFWRMAGREDPVPLAERISSAEQAMAALERLDDHGLLSRGSEVISRLHWVGGDYARHLEASRQPLQWIDRVRSPMDRAELLATVAEATLETGGRFEEALELGVRARDLARRTNPHQLMHTTVIILQALYLLGRWDEIPSVLEEHLAAFEKESEVGCDAVRGGPLRGALFLVHRGEAKRAAELVDLVPPLPSRMFEADRAMYLLAAGRSEEAARLAEGALEQRDVWHHPYAGWVKVEALAAMERWRELTAFMETARSFTEANPLLAPSFDRAEGAGLAVLGDTARGEALLRRALDRFDALAAPFEAARTREALAAVAASEHGDLLGQALSTYQRLGARPHVERAREALAWS